MRTGWNCYEREFLQKEQKTLINSQIGKFRTSRHFIIVEMGGLLGDFDGYSDSGQWEQQVQLLRVSYQLENNAALVLISSKLKGHSFHSKPPHLAVSVTNLLEAIGQIFKYRPSKFLRRKEFENRMGKTSERFC
ncbi:hypothetical protein GWI33_021021 [Rhynchophorus ferrugineus]|uniref:Uncharacterized protein n=1 Tax=Rhynchophorus ferrugineus TaxID=354439 RepID=A0A834HR96_RHYFE|nr:hypothetical protein GWI33_021021 [Rhynchophorus ferrugineus]